VVRASFVRVLQSFKTALPPRQESISVLDPHFHNLFYPPDLPLNDIGRPLSVSSLSGPSPSEPDCFPLAPHYALAVSDASGPSLRFFVFPHATTCHLFFFFYEYPLRTKAMLPFALVLRPVLVFSFFFASRLAAGTPCPPWSF